MNDPNGSHHTTLLLPGRWLGEPGMWKRFRRIIIRTRRYVIVLEFLFEVLLMIL